MLNISDDQSDDLFKRQRLDEHCIYLNAHLASWVIGTNSKTQSMQCFHKKHAATLS